MGTEGPREMMVPAKSTSGMEGVRRKSGGMRVMRIKAPGFRAQCVMRMRAEVGVAREGTGWEGLRERVEVGRPRRVWV